jgi:hypothetical protein
VKRLAGVTAVLLGVLLVPARADAQAATVSVDDTTPAVGQTVTVSTTCPGPGTFLNVNVTIFTIPFMRTRPHRTSLVCRVTAGLDLSEPRVGEQVHLHGERCTCGDVEQHADEVESSQRSRPRSRRSS